MNNKNLLYLNLALDDKDVSLGFADTWIEQFSFKFENIDIITLNKSTESIGENNNVNVGIFVPTPYLFLRLCEKELLKQLYKQNASDEFRKRAKNEVKLIFLNLQEKIDLILICCPPHCSSFILVKHILYLYFENTCPIHLVF